MRPNAFVAIAAFGLGLLLLLAAVPCRAFVSYQDVKIASSPNPVGSGARAIGMGGAFIGIADDATAASWNPAGLIQLELPELSVVGEYFSRGIDFSAPTHPESEGGIHDAAARLNYFSAAVPFTRLNRNMVVAVNYQRLYDFELHLAYRFVETQPLNAPFVSLTTTSDRVYTQDGYLGALGLAWAVQATPRLSFGLTLNVWTEGLGWNNGWKETYRAHDVDVFTDTFGGTTTVVTNPHIEDQYSGFEGVNANLGVLWNLLPSLTLGAVVKLPFTADVEHRETRADLGTVRTETAEIDMPLSYGIGVAWRASDAFSVDLDVYRTRWSDYVFTDGKGVRFNPVTGNFDDQSDVEDTTQVRLGMEYLIIRPDSKLIVPLRAGLFYDPEPAEGKVKDFYGVSVGSGVGYGRFIFDVAYQVRWGDDVDSANLIGASKADIRQHLVLCSFILHF